MRPYSRSGTPYHTPPRSLWSRASCTSSRSLANLLGFKAGHRIRLEIVSFDGQHHMGHLRGKDTFHHDASRASHLVLPVVLAS